MTTVSNTNTRISANTPLITGATVSCSSDHPYLLGDGGSDDGSDGAVMQQSYPDGNGWQVTGPGGESYTAWAICAKLDPTFSYSPDSQMIRKLTVLFTPR